MPIHCPYCGAVNEATVRNDVLRAPLPCLGPVWTCTLCTQQWTDDEAERILDLYHAAARILDRDHAAPPDEPHA